jgi:hypothetical protein
MLRPRPHDVWSFVAGLVPATHVFAKGSVKRKKAWMAGTSPATSD